MIGQPNAWDCGVCATLAAERLVGNESIPEDTLNEDNEDALRAHLVRARIDLLINIVQHYS